YLLQLCRGDACVALFRAKGSVGATPASPSSAPRARQASPLQRKRPLLIRRGLCVRYGKGSSYLPHRDDGRELAPTLRQAQGGCCGFIGPNPLPLSIREILQLSARIL